MAWRRSGVRSPSAPLICSSSRPADAGLVRSSGPDEHAALLFGLYLTARLVVGAAVINATLWDRRVRDRPGESGSMQP